MRNNKFLKKCSECREILHIAEFKRKNDEYNPFENLNIYEICNVCNDLDKFNKTHGEKIKNIKRFFCKIPDEWR
jgi:hypothetical protein